MTGLLDDGDLADLRADQLTALSDTCRIVRGTITGDDLSSYGSATYGTVASYACRVRSLTAGGESQVAGIQTQAQQLFAITLPHDATVRGSDRIEYGTRTFQVLSPTAIVTDTVATRVTALEAT